MTNLSPHKRLIVILAGLATLTVCVFIMIDRYSFALVFLWIISILSVLYATLPRDAHISGVTPSNKHLFLIGVMLLPSLVRMFLYQPDRIHGDDLLTATFSQNYHPFTTNFFSGIPEDNVWVAKFPAPYFLFQKLFLMGVGASVLSVKLSVLPYVIAVTIFTYLIARTLFGTVAGVAAIILYAFMAISIYHETLGLHFISSTAVYTWFFYTLIRLGRQQTRFRIVLTGVSAGMCYLSYPSSYIAIPILVAATIPLLFAKKTPAVSIITWLGIGITVVLAPFVTFALTRENYFVERIQQVSLINGTWSINKIAEHTPIQTGKIIWDNTLLTLSSFIKDGIGGHGGYTFNRQAFFPRIGLLLFLGGTVVLLIKKYRLTPVWLIFLTILLSYVSGMVLTIPPPAYHRLSLAFPFIAIVSAAPFAGITIHKRVLFLFAMATLAIYAGVNVRYVQNAVQKERMIDDAAIIHHINAYYPKRPIYIAAYPTFALGNFFPFFPQTTAPHITTKYHKDFLRSKISGQYVIVMTLPQDFKTDFMDTYPEATYIPFSDKYGIIVNW